MSRTSWRARLAALPIRISAAALLTVACARGVAVAAEDAAQSSAAPVTPASIADELLAADRAFGAKGQEGDHVAVLSRAFAPDVLMLAGPRGITTTAADAVEYLKSNQANAGARLEWTPVRAGIAADGAHGFTYGYQTLTRADGTAIPLKYVAYWVKRPEGWRIAALKRAPRPAGEVSLAVRAPSLPDRLVAPSTDAAAIARYAKEIADVEAAFSAEGAQDIGKAFAKYGAADAVNMGGPQDAEFVLGNEAIGRAVSGGQSGPVEIKWYARHTVAASSGDLGVNMGFIEFGKNPPVPFLTVWRRSGPGQPWRYVAE